MLQIIFSLAPIAACSKQWASKEVTPQAARLLAALKLEQIHNPCFAQIQIHKCKNANTSKGVTHWRSCC